jgi:uncharacterized membrane protein (DUF485 family)
MEMKFKCPKSTAKYKSTLIKISVLTYMLQKIIFMVYINFNGLCSNLNL